VKFIAVACPTQSGAPIVKLATGPLLTFTTALVVDEHEPKVTVKLIV
jgi:hypothetical protein